MDANTVELEKRYGEMLQGLQQKYGKSNPFYIRRRPKEPTVFFDLDKRDVAILQEAGVIQVERTIPRWMDGKENTAGAPDPDPTALTLTLQPKGEELLKSRVTTTTQTITEVFQEPEEPAWKRNKRYRNLARTERGGAILSSSPDALISDVRGHIEVLQRGGISRSEWKARQIWLKYWLLYRGEEIPENLRHEAEDYRDLPFTSRRRNASNQTDSLSGEK
jgi:hypothetical protein